MTNTVCFVVVIPLCTFAELQLIFFLLILYSDKLNSELHIYNVLVIFCAHFYCCVLLENTFKFYRECYPSFPLTIEINSDSDVVIKGPYSVNNSLKYLLSVKGEEVGCLSRSCCRKTKGR